MLQQTQVATVIPYYLRFVRAFPTIRHLAEAPLERVLELWSGLGYYRRARYLHSTAQTIVRNFDGEFPQDYEQARSLDGIGDYTARAVLSIACNLPYTVLDGNVARVIARLRALHGNLHQTSFRRAVQSELDKLLSRRRPGDFNQALMEFGQTVCAPRAPRCATCPLRKFCRAREYGNAESYPEPRPRRAAENQYLAAAIIRYGNKVALIRGLDDGLLGDLWNFPSAFGPSRAKALARLQEKLSFLACGSISTRHLGVPSAELSHGITYRSIRVHLYPAEIPRKIAGRSLRWILISRIPHAAVSQLARKIAQKI